VTGPRGTAGSETASPEIRIELKALGLPQDTYCRDILGAVLPSLDKTDPSLVSSQTVIDRLIELKEPGRGRTGSSCGTSRWSFCSRRPPSPRASWSGWT
jgi:hypothetical protein